MRLTMLMPDSMLMPWPMAVHATPSTNSQAEPTHRFTISSALLRARLSRPPRPHHCVGRLPTSTCTQAEASRITAMAVPLTTGPCQGTSRSRNSGDIEAYRPNTPNARKGSMQVSTKAVEALGSGQVSLGSTSCSRSRPAWRGSAAGGSSSRASTYRPSPPSTRVGM